MALSRRACEILLFICLFLLVGTAWIWNEEIEAVLDSQPSEASLKISRDAERVQDNSAEEAERRLAELDRQRIERIKAANRDVEELEREKARKEAALQQWIKDAATTDALREKRAEEGRIRLQQATIQRLLDEAGKKGEGK